MTGLEPATSGVTGRCSNQLSYIPRFRERRANAGSDLILLRTDTERHRTFIGGECMLPPSACRFKGLRFREGTMTRLTAAVRRVDAA